MALPLRAWPHLQAREAAGLHDVAGAVEAGRHHAVPVGVHAGAARVAQLLGHDRPAEAHAREAGVLGERARLQRDLVGTCACAHWPETQKRRQSGLWWARQADAQQQVCARAHACIQPAAAAAAGLPGARGAAWRGAPSISKMDLGQSGLLM